MADPEADPEWQRVQAALEQCFLAMDRCEAVDVSAICAGDAVLAARVEQLLASEHGVFFVGAAAAEPPLERRTLGDFEILAPLGRGGMGSVFLANQKSLGRQVALKLLDRTALHLPGARLRLRREAELTALLDHPNIVPVYAVGEVDEVPFLAMKFLTGPSLAESPRPLPPERVARIGAALARALDCAHVQGVVHRDVKPANILLDGDTPVFVDFGLARAQSDPTLTQEGKVAGTLRYMAPERLDANVRVLDPRVDIYGLGATLYELLGARPPFEEDNPTALVRSVLSREPPPLRLRGRHHDLETVVMRAMAKDAARRFPTAAAMADDLERYLDQRPVLSRRIPAWARLLRTARRHPRTAATAVLAALALLAVSLVIAWQQHDIANDRSRRLELARSDLERGHHERAAAALALLAERHPADGEVATWFARARAHCGIDQLFVAVTDRTTNVPTTVLADLTHTIEVGASEVLPASTAALALVLATGHCHGLAAARDRLAGLPESTRARRAAHAIAAWLDGIAPPWPLPPPPDDVSADEAIFAGLALRLGGAPPDAVLHELSTIAPRERAAPRVLRLEAIARADRGQTVASLQLLRGLANDEAPAPVWRWLGDLYLRLGRVPEAGAALARAASDASPAAEYLRLAQASLSHQLAGEHAACAKLVDAARNRDPLSAEVERFVAEHDGKSDAAAVPAVLVRLQSLWERQREDRIGRDLTLAVMVDLSARNLPTRAAPGPAGADAAGHRRLLADWWERTRSLSHWPAVALANLWLARSKCHSESPGDLLQGLELFAATCRDHPEHAALAITYAETVAALPPGIGGPVRLTHALGALRVLATVEHSVACGDQVLTEEQLAYVRYYLFLLAWQTQDVVAVGARLSGIEPMLDESLVPRARDDAAAAAAAREKFRQR